MKTPPKPRYFAQVYSQGTWIDYTLPLSRAKVGCYADGFALRQGERGRIIARLSTGRVVVVQHFTKGA